MPDPRRGLVLAGGGMKVAFQAGVLQVWLDEAGIEFDVFDAASGGALNLAMLCEDRKGAEIANAWRQLRPIRAVWPNWGRLVKLYWASSSYSLWAFRRTVLRGAFDLDWEAIRTSGKDATFDVYDFTGDELRRLRPGEMSEDALVACISLPKLFPPVELDGRLHVDAVYTTDADLIGAIERGADELWVIWTVSQTGRWTVGFPHSYFRIVEQAANSRLAADLARIERSNASGVAGEFGRPIAVRLLQAEVPVHYVFVFRKRRVLAAVEQGVDAARSWCADRGIPVDPIPGPAPGARTLRFAETMRGAIAFPSGERADLELRLTVQIADVAAFVADPGHEARVEGRVVCPALGGSRRIDRGTVRLFVPDSEEPGTKLMRYEVAFRSDVGRPIAIAGEKTLRDDPGLDMWRDATTLAVRVSSPEGGAPAGPFAEGAVALSPAAFAHELASFRPWWHRPRTLRFGIFFLRSLASVYLSRSKPTLREAAP